VVYRTLGLLSRNAAVFSLMAVIVFVGPMLATAYGSQLVWASWGNFSAQAWIALALRNAVWLAAGCALQGGVVYGAVRDLNDRRASFRECLSAGLRSSGWLICLSIVAVLAEAGGCLALIVPGLIMATAWLVAAPALVVERLNPLEALGRSAGLTRGHRWALLALIVGYFVGLRALETPVFALLRTATPSQFVSATGPLFSVSAEALARLVASAGVAAVYCELRARREGIGAAGLAELFD